MDVRWRNDGAGRLVMCRVWGGRDEVAHSTSRADPFPLALAAVTCRPIRERGNAARNAEHSHGQIKKCPRRPRLPAQGPRRAPVAGGRPRRDGGAERGGGKGCIWIGPAMGPAPPLH